MVSCGVHVDGRMFPYSVDDESNFQIRDQSSLLEWAKFKFSTTLDHFSVLALFIYIFSGLFTLGFSMTFQYESFRFLVLASMLSQFPVLFV